MSKYTIQNEKGEIIARVHSKADAYLFAAAHDLLEALEDLFFNGRNLQNLCKASKAMSKSRGEVR